MDLLRAFHEAAQSSPIIVGIFVAAHLYGYIPTIPTVVCSIITQHTALAAIVIQRPSRTNIFLDDLNQQFFRPRGLFVFLVSCKGERGKWSTEALDILHAVVKNVVPLDKPTSGNRKAKVKHNMQWTSGTSHGMIEIPESAPLVYPALNGAAGEDEDRSGSTREEKSSKIQSFRVLMGEYSDCRAQALFHAENPDSPLDVPLEKPFASKHSDPTHPANSGSLISLDTGGKVNRIGYMKERDQRLKQEQGFLGPGGYLRQGRAAIRRVARQISWIHLLCTFHDVELDSDLVRGRCLSNGGQHAIRS